MTRPHEAIRRENMTTRHRLGRGRDYKTENRRIMDNLRQHELLTCEYTAAGMIWADASLLAFHVVCGRHNNQRRPAGRK